MSTAKIHAEFTTIDMLSTPETVEVTGAKLREGMVLVDPDLGTPLYGIDHRVRAARNSGTIRFLVADLENGGWTKTELIPRNTYRVVAG